MGVDDPAILTRRRPIQSNRGRLTAGGPRAATRRRHRSGVGRLLRDAQHGADEAVVAGAAAEVAGEADADLLRRRATGSPAGAPSPRSACPGVQNPHCTPPSSRKARCSGDRSPSVGEALDGRDRRCRRPGSRGTSTRWSAGRRRASCRRRTRSRRSPPWSRSGRACRARWRAGWRARSTSTGYAMPLTFRVMGYCHP